MAKTNGGNQTMESEEIIEVNAELVPVGDAVALGAADRAQIDMQIATAKRYPRDIQKAVRDAKALVCTDQDVAISMHYALPRTQDGQRVFIIGPTIRFAEVIAYTWQNLRFEKRVVSIDDTYVTAQATVMDLERNIGGRAEVKRRITYSDKRGRKGARYSEDMIQQTGNAAASIALRNALFSVIPPALTKSIENAAKAMATGEGQPIEARRQKALKWFAQVGADKDRVLKLLDVATVDEITQEHLEMMTALKTSIQDGNLTVEEAFNPKPEQSGDADRVEDLKSRLDEKDTEPQPSSEQNVTPHPAQSLIDALGAAGFEPDSKEVGNWLHYQFGTRSLSDLNAKQVATALKSLEKGDAPTARK